MNSCTLSESKTFYINPNKKTTISDLILDRQPRRSRGTNQPSNKSQNDQERSRWTRRSRPKPEERDVSSRVSVAPILVFVCFVGVSEGNSGGRWRARAPLCSLSPLRPELYFSGSVVPRTAAAGWHGSPGFVPARAPGRNFCMNNKTAIQDGGKWWWWKRKTCVLSIWRPAVYYVVWWISSREPNSCVEGETNNRQRNWERNHTHTHAHARGSVCKKSQVRTF